jgi:predicted lipoprotein with Yx(FWY)xxD motif
MSLPRLPRAVLSVGAVAVVALIIAGCGGSSTTSSTTSSNQETKATAAQSSEPGAMLVDSEGFTVYAFAKDKGTMSSCYGECAEAWPPVTAAGGPIEGEGVMSSLLGTTKRKDGTAQVTYAGHPLYTFIKDSKPGEANGNGVVAFGAEWYALGGAGSPAPASAETESTAAVAPEASNESSGGAYGY